MKRWNERWIGRTADRLICRLWHGRDCPHIGNLGTFWERAFM